MIDPIVRQVRRHRMEHTRKFHGDLDAIYRDLLKVQQTLADRVVRLPPKRIKPRKTAGR